jgi:hypothetical protein
MQQAESVLAKVHEVIKPKTDRAKSSLTTSPKTKCCSGDDDRDDPHMETYKVFAKDLDDAAQSIIRLKPQYMGKESSFSLSLLLSKDSLPKLKSSGLSKASKSIIVLKNKNVNSSKSLPIWDCKTSMRKRAYIRFNIVFIPLSMLDPKAGCRTDPKSADYFDQESGTRNSTIQEFHQNQLGLAYSEIPLYNTYCNCQEPNFSYAG